MKDFSIPKAAFAGYRYLGLLAAPILVWWLINTAYLVGRNVLAAAMAGDAFKALNEMQTSSGPPDLSSMMVLMGETNAYSAVATPAGIIISAVLFSAVLRAMLRPVDKGLFAHVSLGFQELKIALVLVVVTIICFLAAGAMALVGVIGGGVAMSAGSRIMAAIMALAGFAGSIAAFLFLSVKFFFSLPQSAHEKAIRIFESWTLTNGRFWSLLATLLLMIIGFLPFLLILCGISAASAILLGGVHNMGDLLDFIFQPAYTVDENLSAARLISYAALSASSVLFLVFSHGAAASAFMQITGAEPVTTKASAVDDEDDDEDDDDD